MAEEVTLVTNTKRYVPVSVVGTTIVLAGADAGNIRGSGEKVDVEWELVGAPAGQTLKIDFIEFLPADSSDQPAPVSPLSTMETSLSGMTKYKKTLKKLGKGELIFICKYSVEVVGSSAQKLDPVIIIEK